MTRILSQRCLHLLTITHQISDLSFRRHILVQVLIVMDFLLSLSAKAKEKLAKTLPDNLNKSVMYADQALSEEDVSVPMFFLWLPSLQKFTL
jgi:hypothetical protein